MNATTILRAVRAMLPAAALLAGLPCQSPHSPHAAHSPHHHWIAPGRGVLGHHAAPPVRVAAVTADVRIVDRAATTTLAIELHNPNAVQQEAVLLLPVPDGAAVSGFAFEGPAAEPTARILARDEARALYDQITARLRDPALLEFAGMQCLRTSVFPVPPHGRLRLRLAYDHVLGGDGDAVDYVLPRSELLAQDVPWSIAVDLRARSPIALCHSPSHELETVRRSATAMTLRVAERSRRDPGAFRLCFATAARPDQPTAAMFAYPDPSVGGGYLLLLANAPRAAAAPMPREVTLVLDRSGSMAGRKLEQAKAAALQVLEGLADGECMQVIDYGTDVARAFARPVAKDARTMAAARACVDAIRPHGGTNIHDALVEALRAPVPAGSLPLVLFLTDGLPTVGPTSEAELHRMVAAGNRGARRVFCFGVGHDVNVPLLDRIAEATRATTSYVLPEEDVEVAVARTFARLGQPVLAEPVLELADDPTHAGRLSCVVPKVLPDLFAGDQIVVLAQYRDAPGGSSGGELAWRLRGRTPAGDREFRFTLSLDRATTANAFVPRLWASRQIAFLVDELRQRAAPAGAAVAGGADPFADPRLRELRDEILRLSTRHGVLGEYTAFLATEGSRLDDWSSLANACQQQLQGRAVETRSGRAAINQGNNLMLQKAQAFANPRNAYLDANLNRVEVDSIQQVCDRAFLRRGDRWIDGNAVLRRRVEPDVRIELGSEQFFALLRRLEREHRAGVLSLPGEVLLELDGKNVLVTPGASPAPATPSHDPTPKETIR